MYLPNTNHKRQTQHAPELGSSGSQGSLNYGHDDRYYWSCQWQCALVGPFSGNELSTGLPVTRYAIAQPQEWLHLWYGFGVDF
jgi:hypothetical protein